MAALCGQWEFLHPDEMENILHASPVVYLPLGTFEHHSWHLPVCIDGIKAHAIYRRAAEQTGGVVMPTFFYGTGGGQYNYKWTMILPENLIRPILGAILDHLARFGFKVVVLVTGHYPVGCKNLIRIGILDTIQEFRSPHYSSVRMMLHSNKGDNR